MRLLIFISTIISTTILVGFNILTNPISIKGNLVTNLDDEKISKVKIIVKADNKIIKTVLTTRNGKFKIQFTSQNQKSFDFYYLDPDFIRDTLFLKSYTEFESHNIDASFSIPTQYLKDEEGNIQCPKCNKADKVFDIAYGEGVTKNVVVNGESTWTNIFEEEKIYYAQSCIKGMLKYYCNRDEIKF